MTDEEMVLQCFSKEYKEDKEMFTGLLNLARLARQEGREEEKKRIFEKQRTAFSNRPIPNALYNIWTRFWEEELKVKP